MAEEERDRAGDPVPAMEPSPLGGSPSGLYVHVPFCVRKCGYCDFYSLPNPTGRAAPDAARYLAALETELERTVPAEFRARTVFVGGGTPTELDARDLARLLEIVARRTAPGGPDEFTVEANPGTLTREKALVLRESGVTRVSVGVQSFDPRNLAFLGRIHSPEEASASVPLLRDLGFSNINLDLIFGIPGSSREALVSDLEQAAALGPDHIACYCLIFEEGTPLRKLRDAGLAFEVEEGEELAQYELVRDRLGRAGYGQYEISNFARPGRECRHNLLYWGAGEYYGLGPAAHSHVSGARSGNVRDLAAYCEALEGGRLARAFEERLEPAAKARETLVMALRRLDGVSRAAFLRATGFDYLELAGHALERLAGLGLVAGLPDRVRLTERGLFLSDSVFGELV